MKADMTVLLSGLGYYKLSERRRKMLLIVLAASLGVHLLGLLVFGGVKVLHAFRDEKTVFVAPPPMKTYEPRKLEHRVKVQKRQRSSSRPSITPRLVSTKLSKFALPEIKVDPKVIKTSFQPKFKAVAGTGAGVGVGTGYGLGGFGQGVSAFDFFGIRGRGNKIAILVDVSVSMAEEDEEKGVTDDGIKSFERVKHRVNRVIDALSEEAMFNVIVFADSASAWRPDMQVANADAKKRAKNYIKPFNSNLQNLGHSSGNITSSQYGLRTAVGGNTRLDLALTAAFEQGADTILVISDGLPRVLRPYTAAEREQQSRALEKWRKQNENALERIASANSKVQYSEEKVWVKGHKASSAVIKEGQYKKARQETKGHWEVKRQRSRNTGGRRRSKLTPKPKFPEPYWTLEDFITHLSLLQKELYEKKGKKPPVIHCIGYRIDKDGGHFLKGLARHYKGSYRRVASLK